jgi:hypothetical protein
MKKITLILFAFLIGVTFKSSGQKLEVNKTDDFTKKLVKQTSWESLASTIIVNAHYCFSLTGDVETFNLKLMMDKVFFINQDQQIIFKMDNGDIITLTNNAYSITCTGCGAVGFAGSAAEGLEVSYHLDNDQIAKLKAGKITEVRIFTTTESFDVDIKGKNATKVQASLNLL